MRIKDLYVFVLLLFGATVVGCSGDDGYNADTAQSHYTPERYDRTIAGIDITSEVNAKQCTASYNFVYDVQNRIKEINGTAEFYYKNQKCNRTFNAEYFYKNAALKVKYSVEDVYPYKSDWNFSQSGGYKGAFNDNGTLANFDTFDCEYSGTLLKQSYDDYGEEYGLSYDRYNNLIKGYRLKDGEPEEGTIHSYTYTPYTNKTNIDFASFFGFNIIERLIPANTQHPLEVFHLGAFGMFGSRSTHLPEADWELDAEGYPLKASRIDGRDNYVIRYQ